MKPENMDAKQALVIARTTMEEALEQVKRMETPPTHATVTLFKPSGKYYTKDEWQIPQGAVGPYDMTDSPDFRTISGGAVLVETQEPWGYPALLNAS